MSEGLQFGPEYPKIDTCFKRNRENHNIIMPSQLSCPEFDYLWNSMWSWTEKVDGTNVRIHYDHTGGNGWVVGGRTNKAQFNPKVEKALLEIASTFPEQDQDMTLYGEGYGAGVQTGGVYRPDPSFILFDVRVGKWWLTDDAVTEIAKDFGVEKVPFMGFYTLHEATTMVQGGFHSHWQGAPIEGVVGRPICDLYTRAGRRIQTKLKVKDFVDYKRWVNA